MLKYLMCNLKSNKTLKEILKYKHILNNINQENLEFVLFPSNIYLGFFYNTNYKIGSQDLSIHESGSFSGQVLAKQLASLKISYVLINHRDMKESNENIIKKIQNATREKIKVVLCIGEEEKNNLAENITYLTNKLNNILNFLTIEEQKNIILAYEPYWAINTGDTISIDDLDWIIDSLKKYIKKTYNINIDIIYGGSINNININKFQNVDKLDGFLIGNCANNPYNILEILEKI